MARLPSIGGDQGSWGQILNEFLSVVHNADGTLKSDVLDDKVEGSGNSTDMALPRFSGTGGNALQGSDWILDNSKDLILPNGTVSAGQTSGGRIKNANQLLINWDYNQTVTPESSAYIGTGVLVDWTATASDNAEGILGPRLQSHGFGPRGVFQVEGVITVERNLSALSPGPIGYSNQIMVRNQAGAARTLVPDWGFMNNWTYVADGATVPLGTTDSSRGGAGFVDNQVLTTENGGTMTGTANNYIMHSFLSHCFVTEDVIIPGRYGYAYHDLNDNTINVIPGVVPVGTVTRQEAVHVPYLEKASENVGVNNASATINPPQTATISSVSSTIQIDASVVKLNNTSGSTVTLTSTPTMANGYEEGHTVTLINTSANTVVLQGEGTLANTNISKTVTLNQNDSATMVYAGGSWHPNSSSTAASNTTFNPDVLPTGALTQTIPRWTAVGNLATLTSGTLVMVAVRLQAGTTVNSISWLSRTTALAGGINQWFALFNSSRQCLAVTNDDTSTAWAASAIKTLNLTSPYNVTTTGTYYIGIMVNAATPPTLSGLANASVNMTGIAPILIGTSNTAQTTPFVVGNTANALSALGTGVPYAYVS